MGEAGAQFQLGRMYLLGSEEGNMCAAYYILYTRIRSAYDPCRVRVALPWRVRGMARPGRAPDGSDAAPSSSVFAEALASPRLNVVAACSAQDENKARMLLSLAADQGDQSGTGSHKTAGGQPRMHARACVTHTPASPPPPKKHHHHLALSWVLHGHTSRFT